MLNIDVREQKKPAKLSSLARELDTTVQDVHRNVNRLMTTGLVRKKDGSLHLTEYGRIVTNQILYFIFMKNTASSLKNIC